VKHRPAALGAIAAAVLVGAGCFKPVDDSVMFGDGFGELQPAHVLAKPRQE